MLSGSQEIVGVKKVRAIERGIERKCERKGGWKKNDYSLNNDPLNMNVT